MAMGVNDIHWRNNNGYVEIVPNIMTFEETDRKEGGGGSKVRPDELPVNFSERKSILSKMF